MNRLMRLLMALCIAGSAVPTLSGLASAQPSITRDPQVCCVRTDMAGRQYPFRAPRSQCRPPLRIVSDTRCASTLERRICCQTPNGFVSMPESHCTGRGMTRAHPDRCQQGSRAPTGTVCCWTHHGVIARPAGKCPPPGPNDSPMNPHPVPMDQCTKPVCCKTQGAYRMMPAMKCLFPNGSHVSVSFCKGRLRQVCCRMAYPGAPIKYILTDPRKCTAPHGKVVSGTYCRRAGPGLLRPRGG